MYIRWKRRQLKSNRQVGEFLCPHFGVIKPWILAPVLVHKWPDGRTTSIWTPGPSIRECCIRENNEIAIAAWWWEAKNRFLELTTVGLNDAETTQALIEQLDIIEEIIMERIPKPSQAAWGRYEKYREDLSLTRRRVRPPAYLKQLGLPWPFTKEDLSKRWREIALASHPDKGGSTEVFRKYVTAYKAARASLEKRPV